MFEVAGKKAYITGGTSGIGRAVAEVYIENGMDVVVVDITDGTAVAEEIGAKFLRCDVSDESQMDATLVQATELLGGKLDVVVLNAGIGDVGTTFEELDQALLERMTRINQWSVAYGLKHAPKNMNNHGSIISTSSMAAYINVPGCGVYAAGKQAMVSMTQMAALELGKRGIRVNTVCPANVNTALGNSPEEVRLAQVMSALGRPAEPREDVAGVYLFLASSASGYITGQAMQVDGGWVIGPTQDLLELVTGSAASPGSKG